MTSAEMIRSTDHGRVVVTRGAKGWDLKEERDNQVVRERTYTDWHRVERAVRAFELDADSSRSTYSTNR